MTFCWGISPLVVYGAIFSFDAEETTAAVKGYPPSCCDMGVTGVSGASSPASDDEHEMLPAEGEADIQLPRLPGQLPEGASVGVTSGADAGVTGDDGTYVYRRPDRYHSRTTVDARL